MPLRLKGKVIRPVSLYASECWAAKTTDENAMSTAEMKILRWSCGVTRKDKIRNREIRKRMKIAPIKDVMRSNRLRWYGHISRRDENHVCRTIQVLQVAGKGKRGRPKKTWWERVKHDMKLCDVSPEDALDREKWKTCTHTADPK